MQEIRPEDAVAIVQAYNQNGESCGYRVEVKDLSEQYKKALLTPNELVYLAGPYSHKDEAVRIARFEALNKAAAHLMNKGIHIYSPISHTHPIAMAGSLPLGWEFWEKYDRVILSRCYKIIVLKLEGWEISKGVQSEIKIAQELGLEIEYMEVDNGRN